MVALLRGINVGGRGKLPDGRPPRHRQELGYGDVATYIQSGNLVLSTRRPPAKVASGPGGGHRRGERACRRPSWSAREPAGQGGAGQPVPRPRRGRRAPPRRCSPTDQPRAGSPALDLGVLRARGGHRGRAATSTCSCPNGVGRSKLAVDLGRQKGTVGTMRNWRTVTDAARHGRRGGRLTWTCSSSTRSARCCGACCRPSSASCGPSTTGTASRCGSGPPSPPGSTTRRR